MNIRNHSKKVFLLLAMFALSCGSHAGNPSKPDGSTVVIPEIKYDLPTSVTGDSTSLMLAGDYSALNAPDTCSSLFHCKAKRAHLIVKGVNSVIRRIRDIDKVQITGAFRSKGPGRNLSGKIEVIEDGEFTRSATMCFKNKVFLHMKWSLDADRIVVTRDFGANPLSDYDDRTGISRVELTKVDDETTLDFRTESEWEVPPGNSTDGNILNEHLVSVMDADKNVTIASVNDWYATTPTTFEGDHYVTGKINASGQGEFVTYIKSGLCPAGFDEGAADLWNPTFNPGDPRWCYGRKVETSTTYTNNEMTAALQRLEPIGLVSKGSLGPVRFDEDVACE